MNLRVVVRRALIALLLLLSLTGVVGVSPVASAAPTTFEELTQDPTLHRGHSEVLRLYFAVLDRTPEVGGAQFWLNAYDSGTWTTRQIAAFFAESPEFVATYGANVSNDDFVRIVYENVLDRAPDVSGFDFWLGRVNGGMSRAEMILLISNSPEFIDRIPLPGDARTSTGPLVRTTPQVLAYFDAAQRLQGPPNPALAAPGSPAEDYANYVVAVVRFVEDDLDSVVFTPTSRVVTNTTIGYQPTGNVIDNIRTEAGLVADFSYNGITLGSAMGQRSDPIVVGNVTIGRVIALQENGAIAFVFYIANNGSTTVTIGADAATWSVGGDTFPTIFGTNSARTLGPGESDSFVSIMDVNDQGIVFQPGSILLPMSDSSGVFNASFDVG